MTGFYFINSFATSGDQSAIPTTGTEVGTVNFLYGYGSNYSAPISSDPDAILVDRLTFNYLLNKVTNNWQNLYQNGVVPFITSAMNGGSPYSYGINALVLGTDGNVYFSLVSANTTTPGTNPSNWMVWNPDWQARKGNMPLAGVTGGTYSFDTQGSACTLTYTVSGGVINAVTAVAAGGSGYAVGDLIQPNGGNNDAVIRVVTLSGSAVATVTILYGGTGFVAGTAVATQRANAAIGKITLTGTLSSAATFIMKNGASLSKARQWIVGNNTTGAFTTTFKISNGSNVATGTGAVVPQGTSNSMSTIIDTDGSTDVFLSSPSSISSTAYGLTTNSGNAYSVTTTPAVGAPATGNIFTIKFNAANTGTATLNIGGSGAITLLDRDGAALTTGLIIANRVYSVSYNGTNYIITAALATASIGYGDSTNSGNAYSVTTSPSFTTLTTGQVIVVDFNAANTGTATLNANATGAITILDQYGTALTSGAIASGFKMTLVYDGTNWLFTSPTANANVRTVKKQVFTAGGTYTPSTGMLYCIVEAQAGGGGGGGATGAAAFAGGGGSGSYSRSVITAATIGTSQTVTIGAAGSAGANTGATGGTGGATSLGSLVTTNGGIGGGGSTAASSGAAAQRLGGAGGAVGTGDFVVAGNNGGMSYDSGGFYTGYGANSIYGAGGISVITTSTAGNAATGYGAGGSGGASASTAELGGAGTAGVIFITEFCSQ